jgi:hypothetical protein
MKQTKFYIGFLNNEQRIHAMSASEAVILAQAKQINAAMSTQIIFILDEYNNYYEVISELNIKQIR